MVKLLGRIDWAVVFIVFLVLLISSMFGAIFVLVLQQKVAKVEHDVQIDNIERMGTYVVWVRKSGNQSKMTYVEWRRLLKCNLIKPID